MERTLEADKGFAVKRVSRSAFPLAYKYGWTLFRVDDFETPCLCGTLSVLYIGYDGRAF